MPPGGDGFYYFSTYFLIPGAEWSGLDIEINGDILCSSRTDEDDSTTTYPGQAACSGAAFVTEGTNCNQNSL